MSTKIQINSLEALERLIGNDTQLEIEVRNNIVQEFAKKHLKALVNDSVFQNTINACKKELQSEVDLKVAEKIGEVKKNSWGEVTGMTLRKDIRDQIGTVVREKVDGQIAEAVEGGIKLWETDTKSIEMVVEKKFNAQIERFIDSEVQSRLKSVIEKINGVLK
jgi:hypothetical protein